MGIRIQPPDICVPEDDPFYNDHIGREQTAKILTRFIGAIEGPGVLAIDAPWGAGKTTFLNMWKQYLHNEGFPVVMFNAWENDFSGNPFVSLTAELTKGISKYGESVKPKVNKVKKLAKLVPSFVRVGGVGLSSLADAAVGAEGVVAATGANFSEQVASQVDKGLENYWSAKESEVSFKDSLQDLACTLSQARANRPLIVIIDELDRCRPTYAIELLETAKHLFSVDNIVFVLGINIVEMSHSIRALYGSKFDAEGYLRRFIDFDYRLPEATHKLTPVLTKGREKFIIEMLEIIRFKEYCERTKDRFYEQGRELLLHFFRSPSLSLRRVAQSLLRLGMVIEMLSDADHQSFIHTISVLLIIRTADRKLYQRLLRGEATDDKKVADRVMDSLGLQRRPVENNRFNISAYLEAIIIIATQEDTIENIDPNDEIQLDTELLRWHRSRASENNTDETSKKYSADVIQYVDWLLRYLNNPQIFILRGSVGFRASAERLELLSPEFINAPVDY